MSVSTIHPAPLSAWERSVRADALLILVRSKLMQLGSAEAAMAVLGITRGDMAAARDRSPDAKMAPGPPPRPEETRPEPWAGIQPRPAGAPPQADRHDRRFRATPAKASTTARPVSEEGDLRCSRCGEWKPAEDFRLRSDRIGSGTRRSACDPCHARANRSRYLDLKAFEALNEAGITLALDDDDPAARLRCARCGQPLGATDVTTGSVRLAHAGECPA